MLLPLLLLLLLLLYVLHHVLIWGREVPPYHYVVKYIALLVFIEPLGLALTETQLCL